MGGCVCTCYARTYPCVHPPLGGWTQVCTYTCVARVRTLFLVHSSSFGGGGRPERPHSSFGGGLYVQPPRWGVGRTVVCSTCVCTFCTCTCGRDVCTLRAHVCLPTKEAGIMCTRDVRALRLHMCTCRTCAHAVLHVLHAHVVPLCCIAASHRRCMQHMLVHVYMQCA